MTDENKRYYETMAKYMEAYATKYTKNDRSTRPKLNNEELFLSFRSYKKELLPHIESLFNKTSDGSRSLLYIIYPVLKTTFKAEYINYRILLTDSSGNPLNTNLPNNKIQHSPFNIFHHATMTEFDTNQYIHGIACLVPYTSTKKETYITGIWSYTENKQRIKQYYIYRIHPTMSLNSGKVYNKCFTGIQMKQTHAPLSEQFHAAFILYDWNKEKYNLHLAAGNHDDVKDVRLSFSTETDIYTLFHQKRKLDTFSPSEIDRIYIYYREIALSSENIHYIPDKQ